MRSPPVRVDILGPLSISRDDCAVTLGSPLQRKALAVLLINDRAVSTDELIDALWAEHPPATATGTLQTHLSRLRSALGGGPELLTNDPSGYRLNRGAIRLDAARFASLVGEASAAAGVDDGRRACALLAEAVSIWRGPALVEFRYEPFAQHEITRLEEMRLVALEKRIELELTFGRHAEVCGELEALADEHPLHEDLRALLMVALYRSGRQAEALGVYQQLRAALVAELGVEPTPKLRSLERAILDQVPSLAAAVRAPAALSVLTPRGEPTRLERWADSVEIAALDPRMECELLLARGDGQRRSGREREARHTFAAAVRLASANASPDQLAAAALGLAGPPEDAIVGEPLDEALTEHAIRGLPEHRPIVAMLRSRLAVAVIDRGEVDRGNEMAESAITLARSARDPTALAYTLRARHRTWFAPEELAARLALDAELVHLGGELHDPDVLAWGHRWTAIDLLETGDLHAVEAALDELEALAGQLHDAFHWWGVVVRRAGLALAQGPPAKAEPLVMEALGLAGQIRSAYTLGASMLALWALHWHQGRLEENRDVILDVESSFPDHAFLVPHLHLELGDHPRAAESYHRLAVDDFAALLQRDVTGVSRLFALAVMTDLAWRLRDVDRVQALRDLLGTAAGGWAVIHPGITLVAPIDHLLGQVDGLAGDLSASEAHFDAALAACRAAGARATALRTKIAYAEVLRELGGRAHHDTARRLIAEAEASASELDHQGALTRLRLTSFEPA